MKRKNKIQEPIELINDTVTDIKIELLIPNVIENIIVTIFENHHTLALPMHVNGQVFRAWNKSKGGVFSKDVLNFTLKKPHGKYILIKGITLNCVARIVSEEEELQFKTLKLVDGQIKDKPYMILKNLRENEKLASTQRYINEKDMEPEDNMIVNTSQVTSQDDDLDRHVGSISLFTSD
jgi:hypothetical protein